MKLQEEAAPEPGTKIMFKKPTKRKEASQDDSSVSKRYKGRSHHAYAQQNCRCLVDTLILVCAAHSLESSVSGYGYHLTFWWLFDVTYAA